MSVAVWVLLLQCVQYLVQFTLNIAMFCEAIDVETLFSFSWNVVGTYFCIISKAAESVVFHIFPLMFL